MKHTQKGNIKLSAVAHHVNQNPTHAIHPKTSLKLVEYEPKKFYRKLKESLCIQRCPKKMNTNEGWKLNPIIADGSYSSLKTKV